MTLRSLKSYEIVDAELLRSLWTTSGQDEKRILPQSPQSRHGMVRFHRSRSSDSEHGKHFRKNKRWNEWQNRIHNSGEQQFDNRNSLCTLHSVSHYWHLQRYNINYLSWKLALVLLGVTPLIVLSLFFSIKNIIAAGTNQHKQYSAAGAIAHEVISAIRTVMSFNGQCFEIER